jgi:hypothetical protein
MTTTRPPPAKAIERLLQSTRHGKNGKPFREPASGQTHIRDLLD